MWAKWPLLMAYDCFSTWFKRIIKVSGNLNFWLQQWQWEVVVPTAVLTNGALERKFSILVDPCRKILSPHIVLCCSALLCKLLTTLSVSVKWLLQYFFCFMTSIWCPLKVAPGAHVPVCPTLVTPLGYGPFEEQKPCTKLNHIDIRPTDCSW